MEPNETCPLINTISKEIMELECKSQDNGIYSNNVPDNNELLGSVTQQTDSEGGIQLRTSARVSKKLKLDSLAQATQSTTEKKELSNEEEKRLDSASTEGKPRAKRVDWSTEDKFAFFEALNEFGKDIDAIHNYLVMKAKRRGGGQELKTKGQVRFFYYRMWSILSKHINFPSYIKKQTQELYALINFGELRKKISLSNKKHYEKLSEMIYSGSTQLKFRGKVRKVRTPLCKALRKLNQIEESLEELRLPSCVTLELRPRHNEDWCRVQALAQNPRVRSVLPLHRRIESLLAFLIQRWQTDDQKLREQLSGSEAGEEWVLHVGPKVGCQGSEPTVRLSEVATSSKLSLLAYEQRFHPTTNQVHTLLNQLPAIHRGKSRGVKRPRADSFNSKDIEEGVVEAAELKSLSSDVIETAVGQLLSLNCFTENDAVSPRQISPVKDCEVAINMDQANSGWTLETASSVRVGDVYMMFGCEGKVQLDYWWERSTSTRVSDNATENTSILAATLQKLISVAKVEMFKSKQSPSSHVGPDSKISSSKSRLNKPRATQENVQKVDTQLKFQVCPLPLDGVFRRPIIASASLQNNIAESSTVHLDNMRARYFNRRGRVRRPLHPPRISNSMSLFTAVTAQPTNFQPITPVPIMCETPITVGITVTPVLPKEDEDKRTEEGQAEQVPSPPSLSNLLEDLSLPSINSSRLSTPVPTFEGNSVFRDSKYRDSTVLPTYKFHCSWQGVPGMLSNNEANTNSPSSSKDQWISSEVADMSLSGFSFLNNLDTDIKAISDDTRLSDVDSQLRNLVNTDNSTDLNEIIADLTATINTNTESN